jgi:hypothetical protein
MVDCNGAAVRPFNGIAITLMRGTFVNCWRNGYGGAFSLATNQTVNLVQMQFVNCR